MNIYALICQKLLSNMIVMIFIPKLSLITSIGSTNHHSRTALSLHFTFALDYELHPLTLLNSPLHSIIHGEDLMSYTPFLMNSIRRIQIWCFSFIIIISIALVEIPVIVYRRGDEPHQQVPRNMNNSIHFHIIMMIL